MDEIHVEFDRADRQFHYGEAITGRVVVEAGHDITYRDVQISYCWRTHGRGDRDSGGERRLVLCQEFALRKGERRELPFSFEAPMGPVTYHGHKFNVDWYLSASATHGLRCEEDFILLGKEASGEITPEDEGAELTPAALLETRQGTGPHEIRSFLPGAAGAAGGLAAMWITGTIVAVSAALLSSDAGSVSGFVVAAVLVAIMLAVTVTRQYSYKRKLDVREPRLEPDLLYPGGHVHCRWDLGIRQDVYLQSIEATISSKEWVSHATGGTSVVTEEYALGRKNIVKTYDEQLSSGRFVRFECSLPVEEDAAPSFTSAHSRLDWWVELRVNLQGWQGTTRHIPIAVLPHGYMFDY